MERTQVLIVEDELIIAEKIKQIIEEIGYEVVGMATSYEEGMLNFTTSEPEIVLADINLRGEKDGVELIVDLRKKFEFKAVFITSYFDTKTVERVKAAKPEAYLVKPFGKQDLYTTIEMVADSKTAIASLVEDRQKEVYVKSNNAIIKIELDKILAIRSEDIYCIFMMDDGKEHIVRNSMKQLLEKLGEDFIRIHKSYMIRFERIEKVVYDGVQIAEHKFPIGRKYREELMQRLDVL